MFFSSVSQLLLSQSLSIWKFAICGNKQICTQVKVSGLCRVKVSTNPVLFWEETFPMESTPFLCKRLCSLVKTMDKNDFAVMLKQIWNFYFLSVRVGIYYSSEWSSSEIRDLFREHLALTREIIKERKNKKNSLYNIWSKGTLRCFSRLLYLECSLSCYLWLHSLSCGLYLFVLFGYSSLWNFFGPPRYELARIHFKGLLIMMEFTCFGTSLWWAMLVRCFLQFMVYRL